MAISKRERVARGLADLGLIRMLTWAARRPGLLTLAYHRIGPCQAQPFDDGLFSASVENFRAQVLYLRNHFQLLSIDELLHKIRHGLNLRQPTALITFDDGYRDNCELAYPVLREIDAPAVFFISAGYIDQPRLTWWDRIAYVVKNTERGILAIEYPESVRLNLHEVGQSRAIMQILRLYKNAVDIDQQVFFRQLEAEADVFVDTQTLGRGLFMSWDQVRELKEGGMEIGGHTYDHPVLSRISEEDQRRELSWSKYRLDSETGSNVRLMAYPVGGLDSFSKDTKRLAREVGYEAAFSYYGGFNRPGEIDPFDVRRISVERDDSLAMFRFRAATWNLFGKGLL